MLVRTTYGTGTQLVSEVMRLLNVLSEDSSTQAEASVIGTLDNLVHILEGQDAHYRTEDFLVRKRLLVLRAMSPYELHTS